jgi:ketosteroid isomerase-like protein
MAATKAALAYAFALLCVIVAIASPAFAEDADLKKQMDQLGSAYMEGYKQQDAAAIAALYATGGILVNPAGAHTDIAKLYDGAFKAGLNQLETKIDQVWPLGSDAAIGMGTYRVTGKNQSGAPIEQSGLWTGTYVREGGKMKIRMLTAIPAPPPAK